MAVTPDLDLSILLLVRRAEALAATLESLEVLSRADRARAELVLTGAGQITADLDAAARGLSLGGVQVVTAAEATVPALWNRALKQARGVWVLRLEAGDRLLANPLPYLDRHPAATSVQFAVRQIRGRRQRTRRPRKLTERNCLRWLTAGNPVRPQGLVFRKVFATHPFDETLEHLHEWAFWLLNRGVFDRPAVERRLALVATASMPSSLNRAAAAPERVRIAERMMKRLRFRLPRSQRNNLRLHQSCGLRHQGQRAPFFKTLLSLPSDSVLYLRSLVSLLLGRAAARR